MQATAFHPLYPPQILAHILPHPPHPLLHLLPHIHHPINLPPQRPRHASRSPPPAIRLPPAILAPRHRQRRSRLEKPRHRPLPLPPPHPPPNVPRTANERAANRPLHHASILDSKRPRRHRPRLIRSAGVVLPLIPMRLYKRHGSRRLIDLVRCIHAAG